MNRIQRMQWLSTYNNLTNDEKLILLQGFYEAIEDISEVVDELLFDREISDKAKLLEIQKHLATELREYQHES